MPTPDTAPQTSAPAAQPTPQPASTDPIGTPPGGGSWRWDATQAAWVSVQPEQPTATEA